MSKRLRIYHLLTKQTTLVPDRGDKINEISFLTALSQFADVYYNEQRFQPDLPDYGIQNKPIRPPKGHYDLYIIRNNLEIFRACPHPKVWVASPYIQEAFEEADAVFTFTEAWKHGLENFNTLPDAASTYFHDNYPADLKVPQKVINIGQTVSPHFFEPFDAQKCFRYEALMGYGFSVGYFGRLEPHTMPNVFMNCVPDLAAMIKKLTLVFAGRISAPIDHSKAVVLPQIPYEDMPHATSACKVILANEQREGSWAGSIKPLEALVRGVPFLTTPRPVRIEQLGADYPLYYNTEAQLIEHMHRLVTDEAFLKEIQHYSRHRAKTFTVEKMAEKLQEKILPLLR